MKKKIIKIFLATILIFLFLDTIYSKEFGKIFYIKGSPIYVAMDTGEKIPIKSGSIITTGKRIITDLESSLQIVLNDGSTLLIKENSMVSFFTAKHIEKDEPTKIDFQYGMIKLTLKPKFENISIRVYTPTAIISSINANFSIISAFDESKTVVHNGKVAIASRRKNLKKAYIIKEGMEQTVIRNIPLPRPVKIKREIELSLFQYYILSYDRKKILKTNIDTGFLDWILRKREF